MNKSLNRLYETLQPTNYQLNLALEPSKLQFSGSVTIKASRTGRPSQRITLHQKDLRISSAEVVYHSKNGDETIKVDRINTQNKFNEVRLHTAKKLFSGKYTINVEFSGKITNPMNGLYPCYFTDNDEKSVLLATQFESHHAREVFPCIDEPEAKATFDLSLVSPAGETVTANTPVLSSKTTNKKTTTIFETTPIMSTYLLAFAVGKVGYKEAKTNRGTVVRTYATPNNVQFTDFALETAVKCLEFYEQYFDIPYPLEKCDMIALPDFSSGAMENWGLITYREQCMLVDPKNTSLATKQYVAMVVAHELAHQWFGNLVTMKWWTDLWLNEGFASWIEYLAIDKLFPDWQMWTQFIANEQQSALKLDALENTHPIEVVINHPDEIRTIFDAISYNKGASVIHMLHGYLGPNDFRDGLRHYLKKHAYKNTTTLDLWSSLEHVSKKPVKDFMHSWTAQPGFPLVKVSSNKKYTTLEQERFYVSEPSKKDAIKWPIPVLDKPGSSTSFDSLTYVSPTAIEGKINMGQSGFYRTIYDETHLEQISKSYNSLEPLDRLGLIADSFEAAKANYTSITDALTLLSKTQNESDAAVWDIIASSIGETRRTMDDDDVRKDIKPFIRKITATQLKRLGWKEAGSDTYFDKLLRPTILGLASSADEKSVVDEALRIFKSAKSHEDIPADLRAIVLTTAARHGNNDTYNKLMDFHNSTESSDERNTIAVALTAFEQPELIIKSLKQITSKNVRRQDAMYWVAYSFMNRFAKHQTWEWMKENWSWLEKELGSDLSFSRTPIYAARAFSNKEFIKEYDKFFDPKSSPTLDRSIKQGKEMLTSQIAWKQRDLKAVQDFLKSA